MATAEELDKNSDNCAICWEKMDSARKLPCGHLFHNGCLQSWMEQEPSCPTCRLSLTLGHNQSMPMNSSNNGGQETSPRPRLLRPVALHTMGQLPHHFFHFDGKLQLFRF